MGKVKYKPGTPDYERYQRGYEAGRKAGTLAYLKRKSKQYGINLLKYLDEE